MHAPADLDAVSATWLTEVLSASGALRGVVRSVEPMTLGGGIAVTSRVGRFELTIDGDGPRSVVVKVANPAWTSKYGISLYEREVRFYREIAANHALPVPLCFHAACGADEGFALVLEDLGDARPGICLDGLGQAESECVLDALADMHRSWWEHDALEAWPVKAHTTTQGHAIFDRFRERWPRLVEQGRFVVSDALATAVERMDAARFASGLAGVGTSARTLIHSDLHAENVILDGRRPVFIDWQNAAAGHPVFDVAQVLGAVQPDVLARERRALIERYRARLGMLDGAVLVASLRAAVEWLFVGLACWLVVFEEENLRDAATVQAHWARIVPLFLGLDAASA
ncbi:MAG: aminoglycoside phosphotransferase family protein [Planctomycetota bacterium]|nr:aminoglycoside phosphotransferase family protein [Planctomycetota bacterium]